MSLHLPQFIQKRLAQVAIGLEKIRPPGKPSAMVFCYHSVSGDGTIVDVERANFLEQLDYLRAHFDIVPISEVVAVAKGKKQISRSSVALTFDDGYKDLLEVVVPILSRYNLPATVFALAKPQEANRDELDNDKTLLSYDDLRCLRDLGWTIGSHTLTHPDLRKLKKDKVRLEIAESKQVFEKELGVKVRYFAYPKGIMTSVAIETCQRAGYEAAFSASPGKIRNKVNLFTLPRVLIYRPHTFTDFQALLTGVGQRYLRYKLLLISLL